MDKTKVFEFFENTFNGEFFTEVFSRIYNLNKDLVVKAAEKAGYEIPDELPLSVFYKESDWVEYNGTTKSDILDYIYEKNPNEVFELLQSAYCNDYYGFKSMVVPMGFKLKEDEPLTDIW